MWRTLLPIPVYPIRAPLYILASKHSQGPDPSTSRFRCRISQMRKLNLTELCGDWGQSLGNAGSAGFTPHGTGLATKTTASQWLRRPVLKQSAYLIRGPLTVSLDFACDAQR